jgi:hypothetical protein
MHLCTCVREEGDDGEDVCSETPSLLSYTRRQFRRGRQRLPGSVPRTDGPVYIRERGGGRRGSYVFRNAISAVIHT